MCRRSSELCFRFTEPSLPVRCDAHDNDFCDRFCGNETGSDGSTDVIAMSGDEVDELMRSDEGSSEFPNSSDLQSTFKPTHSSPKYKVACSTIISSLTAFASSPSTRSLNPFLPSSSHSLVQSARTRLNDLTRFSSAVAKGWETASARR